MIREKNCLIICSFLMLLLPSLLYGQCNNNVKFPQGTLNAPVNEGDTVLISDIQFAGDYSIMTGFVLNGEYIFTSSNPNDFITLRTENRDSALAFGNTPLNYSIDSITTISIHINTSNPACGNNSVNRATQVIYAPAIMNNPHVGVNENDPEATLDVKGKIKIGDDSDAPIAGMIRWNPVSNDFEGYDGNIWKSLTKANGNWGAIPQHSVNEVEKLTALDTSFFKEFGGSVSHYENFVIIGVRLEIVNGNQDQGAAYIFEQQGGEWIQQVKLTANDGAAFDYFGSEVSIFGDKAVVGCASDDYSGLTSAGAVYAYKYDGNTWNFDQKITPSNAASFSDFGNALSIDNDQLAVGSYYANHGGNVESGVAYIYTYDGINWGNEQIISPDDAATGDLFGYDISIHDDQVIIGAALDDIAGQVNQGSAYIFKKVGNSWIQQIKLLGAPVDNTEFGSEVDIHGNYAIVASLKEVHGNNYLRGSAYIYFNDGTWSQQEKIRVKGSQVVDPDLGRSVAINDQYAVIGMPKREVDGNVIQGMVQVYARSGTEWCKQAALIASDGKAYDRFGFAVSLYNQSIMVGAYLDELTGDLPTGSVYFFNKSN